MLGKVYESNPTFRKKKRRIFPKEVANEACANNEDLFAVFFKNRIKEMKQKQPQKKKTKNVRNKKTENNGVWNCPSLSAVEEVTDENSFDKLLKGPSYRHVKYVALMPNVFSPKLEDMTNKNKITRKQGKCRSTRKGKENYVNESKYRKSPVRCSNGNNPLSEVNSEITTESHKRQNIVNYSPNYHVSNRSVCDLQGSVRTSKITSTPATFKPCFQARIDCSPITPLKSTGITETESHKRQDNVNYSPNYHVSNRSVLCDLQGSVRTSKITNTPATFKPCFQARIDCSPITPLKSTDIVYSVPDGLRLDKSEQIHTPDMFTPIKTIDCRKEEDVPSLSALNINDVCNSLTTPKTQQSNISHVMHSPDSFTSFSALLVEGFGVTTRRRPRHCGSFFSPEETEEALHALGRLSCCAKRQIPSCAGNQSSVSIRRSFVRRSHQVISADSPSNVSGQPSAFREVYLASTSLLLEHTSTHSGEERLTDESEQEIVITFKDIVLQRCHQSDVIRFAEAFPDTCLENCQKVGEGVYGEVYSCQRGESASTVLKIMPIEGDVIINGEAQKTFEDILSEIVIAMELSNLRYGTENCTSSFTELVRCWCVQGQYPPRLIELWHKYDNEKCSENDTPEYLPADQIYIALELSHGGGALENYHFSSADQAVAAFKQVAYALAVAEAALEFEHRDLHWGNILIKPTKEKTIRCSLFGEEISIPSKGIQVSVIDFTLSRMTYDGCCIFNNLAGDPEIFEGKGDYQFDVYRLMQEKVSNNWQLYEPYTNVLWLSYVLDKLISKAHYRNRMSKIHKKGMAYLKDLKDKIIMCNNAGEVTDLL